MTALQLLAWLGWAWAASTLTFRIWFEWREARARKQSHKAIDDFIRKMLEQDKA